MDNIDQIAAMVIQELKKYTQAEELDEIPVGISNRHIHLSLQHLISLFGTDSGISKMKDLSQPGQFACEEGVTLVGPKGCIENVRILGPIREQTQVEILAADCFKLGIKAPVRLSGKLEGTPGLVISGPKGIEKLDQGVIIAQRHIHMTPDDAIRFHCSDNEVVRVEFKGERGGILDQVVVRVTDKSKLDFHIDTEEANCMGMTGNSKVKIVK
jgi:propanediol utilization protein